MKPTSPSPPGRRRALWGLVILLALSSLWLWSRMAALDARLQATLASQEVAGEEAVELAGPMAALQRFAGKLHFAGTAEHWELAGFYLHEIEETVEELARHNVVEDGIAITPLLQAMLQPAIERIEEAVAAADAAGFAARYEQFLDSCNTCHQATKHGFIRITVPSAPMYPNQDFTRPTAK